MFRSFTEAPQLHRIVDCFLPLKARTVRIRAVRDEDFLALQRRYKAAFDACRDLADTVTTDELSARRFDVALEELVDARDALLAALTVRNHK